MTPVIDKPIVTTPYPKTLSDPNSSRPNVTVRNADDEAKYRADGYTVEVPAAEPVPLKPGPATEFKVLAKKFITMLIGDRVQPAASGATMPTVTTKPAPIKKQTAIVNHHDTVVDILKFHSQPTDGSVVMLKPGTLEPFAMDDQPYEIVKDSGTVEVVPNRADQIGPFLTDEHRQTALNAAIAVQPPPPAPSVSGYPKTLADSKGLTKEVGSVEEEATARADGFTVDVLAEK